MDVPRPMRERAGAFMNLDGLPPGLASDAIGMGTWRMRSEGARQRRGGAGEGLCCRAAVHQPAPCAHAAGCRPRAQPAPCPRHADTVHAVIVGLVARIEGAWRELLEDDLTMYPPAKWKVRWHARAGAWR